MLLSKVLDFSIGQIFWWSKFIDAETKYKVSITNNSSPFHFLVPRELTCTTIFSLHCLVHKLIEVDCRRFAPLCCLCMAARDVLHKHLIADRIKGLCNTLDCKSWAFNIDKHYYSQVSSVTKLDTYNGGGSWAHEMAKITHIQAHLRR